MEVEVEVRSAHPHAREGILVPSLKVMLRVILLLSKWVL